MHPRRAAFFLMVFLTILSVTLPAQRLPRIAVLPFNAVGVSQSDAEVLTSLFEAAMVNTRVFEVIEQSQAGSILAAQAHSLSGCTDEGCAVEIGKLLAAENIILGNVSRLGEMFIVTAKIIDVTTGKNIRADSVQGMRIEEMTQQVAVLASKLAGLTYQGPGQAAGTAAQGGAAGQGTLSASPQQTGEVFVRTDPAGAEVSLNGLARGQSPILLKSVPAGTLLVEARKGPLYASKEVTVRGDELMEITLTLTAAAGRLFLTTDDPALKVALDGKAMGAVGAGLFKDIQPGSHELVIRNDDRYWKGSVTVEPGRTTELEIYPVWTGTVSWRLPEKATAVVTGEMVTREFSGLGEEKLPAGNYHVTVSGPYYLDWETDLEVAKGKPVVIAPDLEFSDTPEALAYLAALRISELEARRTDLRKRIRALQPRSWVRTTGWITGGITGACLLVTGVAGVIAIVNMYIYNNSDDALVIARARENTELASFWMNEGWFALGFGIPTVFLLTAKVNDDPAAAAERERLSGELAVVEADIETAKEAER